MRPDIYTDPQPFLYILYVPEVCAPFYIVTYYRNLVTTSWTDGRSGYIMESYTIDAYVRISDFFLLQDPGTMEFTRIWIKPKGKTRVRIRPSRTKTRISTPVVTPLNLSYDGGGALCAPDFLFIFLLKISPPDQTLRPTCKFLIMGTFYHTIFFSLKI